PHKTAIKKLGSWTSKELSMACRRTLISSPKCVMRKINSLCSSFLWHGTIGIYGRKGILRRTVSPKGRGGKNPWPEIKSFATTSWLLFILNRNPTFDRIAAWNPDSEAVCLFCLELGYKLISHSILAFSLVGCLNWLPIAHVDKIIKLAILQANCVFMSSRENVRDAFMMVFLGAFLGSLFLTA
ncbi:hypothetical protein HID58_046686, partial [Brassica napus]